MPLVPESRPDLRLFSVFPLCPNAGLSLYTRTNTLTLTYYNDSITNPTLKCMVGTLTESVKSSVQTRQGILTFITINMGMSNTSLFTVQQ